MKDEKFLAAYTPVRDDIDYKYYPPFINFTQYGEMVQVLVRNTESLDLAGNPIAGQCSVFGMPKDTFRQLLQDALLKLDEDECALCNDNARFNEWNMCDEHLRQYLATFNIHPEDLNEYRKSMK